MISISAALPRQRLIGTHSRMIHLEVLREQADVAEKQRAVRLGIVATSRRRKKEDAHTKYRLPEGSLSTLSLVE